MDYLDARFPATSDASRTGQPPSARRRRPAWRRRPKNWRLSSARAGWLTRHPGHPLRGPGPPGIWRRSWADSRGAARGRAGTMTTVEINEDASAYYGRPVRRVITARADTGRSSTKRAVAGETTPRSGMYWRQAEKATNAGGGNRAVGRYDDARIRSTPFEVVTPTG